MENNGVENIKIYNSAVVSVSMDNQSSGEGGEDGSLTTVHIVPTSHFSDNSIELVRSSIMDLDPDVVALELDDRRYASLKSYIDRAEDGEDVSRLSYREIFAEFPLKQAVLLSMFSSLQSMLSNKLGVSIAGREFIEAIKTAEERGIPVAPVDRDISETMDSIASSMGFFTTMKILGGLVVSSVYFAVRGTDKLKEDVELDMSEGDSERMIEEAVDKFPPSFRKGYVDERDEFMCAAIGSIEETVVSLSTEDQEGLSADELGIRDEFVESGEEYSGLDIVLVIGAAHLSGVREGLQERGIEYTVIK